MWYKYINHLIGLVVLGIGFTFVAKLFNMPSQAASLSAILFGLVGVVLAWRRIDALARDIVSDIDAR